MMPLKGNVYVFETIMTYRHNVLQMPSLCCNIMNDQGGQQVFKAVPEWICSLLVCVCVPAGRRLSKEQAKCQECLSVMLIQII